MIHVERELGIVCGILAVLMVLSVVALEWWDGRHERELRRYLDEAGR